ncbi:MAG: Gfo/Idh/MocA family oxidoreductase [Lentisphaeria bacterium]
MNIGIVGVAGRGKSFKVACETCENVKIQAICDIKQSEMAEVNKFLHAEEQYTDYNEMLEKADIQAVILGTPMQFHAQQAIAALNKNIHVLCEVTAAVSVKECKELVAAAKKSKATYMMAENYCYTKEAKILKQLSEKKLFGELYYAEGEYIHDCTYLADGKTPWRRHWQMGIEGITYCTHSLGPILQCMKKDRVVKVCCEAPEQRRKDKKDKDFCRYSPVMLCKTEKGALIKIRVDLTSKRPHNMTSYRLQGEKGAYENGQIWLEDLAEKPTWMDLKEVVKIDSYAKKYVSDEWQNPSDQARQAGHGGGDFFEFFDFINAVNNQKACSIGIHEAMDMTLPGLISQQSILRNGQWMDVPNSRDW